MRVGESREQDRFATEAKRFPPCLEKDEEEEEEVEEAEEVHTTGCFNGGDVLFLFFFLQKILYTSTKRYMVKKSRALKCIKKNSVYVVASRVFYVSPDTERRPLCNSARSSVRG